MSKLRDFENEAKGIAEEAESYAGKGSGSNPRSLANIQPPPASAKAHETGRKFALKHGAYSYLRAGLVPGCHLCILRQECDRFSEDSKECSVVLEMQDELIRGVMNLPQIKDEDIILVEELARTKTFLWIVDKWLSRMGPFKLGALKDRRSPRLVAQDILKQRWTAANSMGRMCEQLGLSPLARARLKLGASPFDLPKAMAEVEEEDAK